MTCKEAQDYMQQFLRDGLDNDVCEEFLKHVGSCPQCKEELQVTHILVSALEELETDTDSDGDYPEKLRLHLQKAEQKVQKNKRRKRINYILLPITLLILLLLVGYYSPEEVTVKAHRSGKVPEIFLPGYLCAGEDADKALFVEFTAERKEGRNKIAAYLKELNKEEAERSNREAEEEKLLNGMRRDELE